MCMSGRVAAVAQSAAPGRVREAVRAGQLCAGAHHNSSLRPLRRHPQEEAPSRVCQAPR